MEILLIRHYPLFEGPSMRSFSDQIAAGLSSRGHNVREITAPVIFGRLAARLIGLPKRLGYIDQFILFRLQLWWLSRSLPRRTLCVFVDQALGPWIPALKNHPHVVHVHDLLALLAARGRQPFHRLSWSGCLYQHWIRHGFCQARYFLSVSVATREALTSELRHPPRLNAVLLNPLPLRFRVDPPGVAATEVAAAIPVLGSRSFLFHIGRNWYKNRQGVLLIWEQLFSLSTTTPPALVLVGDLEPTLQRWLDQRPHLWAHLYVLDCPSDAVVFSLYNRAAALLFPSHAEGFGWPVLEALACGCPVITTSCAPMTEVGGDCATYIPAAPKEASEQRVWAQHAAEQLVAVLSRSAQEQHAVRARGIAWASSFSQQRWLDQLEAHYSRVLNHHAQYQCLG